MNQPDQALDLIEAKPDIATEDGENAFLARVRVLERGGRFDEAMALLDGALARRASAPLARLEYCSPRTRAQSLSPRSLRPRIARTGTSPSRCRVADCACFTMTV